MADHVLAFAIDTGAIRSRDAGETWEVSLKPGWRGWFLATPEASTELKQLLAAGQIALNEHGLAAHVHIDTTWEAS